MIYDNVLALQEWFRIYKKIPREYFVQKRETNTTWCHIQTRIDNEIVLIHHPMIHILMINYFLSLKELL